jgi:hypothetical protein
VPPAAAATIATPQIDLSDSDSNSSSDSSADDDSGSCVIVEPVGNKGKTSFVCLSGDIRRVMLDKVKANASKGNPNASSHEVAKTMLQSVWAIVVVIASDICIILPARANARYRTGRVVKVGSDTNFPAQVNHLFFPPSLAPILFVVYDLCLPV